MELDNLFYRISRSHPDIHQNIRRLLLNAKCTSQERTMTLTQIRTAYRELTEEKFPTMADPRVELCFLLSAPFIACFSNQYGTFHFYVVPQEDRELGV